MNTRSKAGGLYAETAGSSNVQTADIKTASGSDAGPTGGTNDVSRMQPVVHDVEKSRDVSPARSVGSTSSVASTVRRQRALEIKLKAAQRRAEIERRLIDEQEKLEMAALEEDIADLDDDNVSVRSISKKRAETDCTTVPYKSLENFLARQTSARDLPTYSGDVEEWALFYSTFKSSTNLCNYSEQENIARLTKCLKGKARDAVLPLLVSGTNLEKILKTLKLRFGRPESIIEVMMAKIKRFREISGTNLNDLIEYATLIQNMVATMLSTDQVGHMTNPTLLKEVVSKLPIHLKHQWTMDISRGYLTNGNLQDTADWLINIAEASTHLTPVVTSDKSERPKRVMAVKTTNCVCQLCNQDHHISKCRKFLDMSTNDRWAYVTKEKLCFSCLSSSHQLQYCKTKTRCIVGDCTYTHHNLLHATPLQTRQSSGINRPPVTTSSRPSTSRSEPNDNMVTATVNNYVESDKCVLLKIVKVVISGDNGEVETTALLDEGSSVSLIDSGLASRAGISGPIHPLRLCGAHGMTSMDNTSQIVDFNVRGHACDLVYKLVNVRTVKNLCLPTNNVNYKSLLNDFPFMCDYVTDADLTDKPVEILIGQDNIDLIVTREIIQGPKRGPIISKTNLGYVVHGNLCNNLVPFNATVLNICSCELLNDSLKQTFTTEDFGCKFTSTTSLSRLDKRAVEIIENTTTYKDGRWETGLLWKHDSPILPDNYPQAQRRFEQTKRKMAKEPEFALQYFKKIDDYQQKGYITKLTPDQAQVKTDKTWYLPHFSVYNPNKPNKFRLVFDAAAKTNDRSLNDYLLQGPDYLNSLPGVLTSFRCHQFAVTGDIKEMFHQVRVRQEDRDSQRFLWVDGEYQMNVLIFGAICSPCSAQYVKNLNAERYKDTHPRAAEAIVKRHYMDDFIDSIQTEEELINLVRDVIDIHATGGFTMTNFTSNSKKVLLDLPSDKLASGGQKIINNFDDKIVERVLGVHWDPQNDNFMFTLDFKKIPDDIKNGTKTPSKRDILKLTMSIFDPLGFLLPITIKVKIILQDLWKTKLGWDDEINSTQYERWLSWLSVLQEATNLTIPRWLLTPQHDSSSKPEIHIFCDASVRAFASVAYIRTKLTDGTYHLAIVIARARVAPVKILSVPRLELQAAVLATRMGQALKDYIDLDISTVTYWTDSKTVLNWLRSDAGRFKPFVAHRVSEITDSTNVLHWRWVPTLQNPADDATRESLKGGYRRWINGPDFLRQDEAFWPVETPTQSQENNDPEVRRVHVTVLTKNESLPDVNRFSQYWRLIRSTAWILRFVYNLRNKNNRQTGELTTQELTEAELHWIKESQRKYFFKDIEVLRTGQPLKNNSTVKMLYPRLDQRGILRVNGRINSADIQYDLKQPTILNPQDPFVKLLILQYHKDALHIGKEQVLNNLRQKYWIIRGRSAVKAAWRQCQECKNKKATPIPPLMGQIPDARMRTYSRPFSSTGLDYFGPILIKIGRRQEKRYGALFTCLTVRAVHIELVNDLSTSSAILAIRRFAARRGTPKEIWTDNATTFKGADKELQKAIISLDHDELEKFCSIRQIQWKFIPPNSPHHGGCWERMVRSVKTALKMTLKERIPSEPTLLTLLLEAEFMINNRPLTHVSLDHEDDLPLTPNHFLFSNTMDIYQPVGSFNDRDLLRRSWKESQRLADLLWKRWVKEYMPTLTRRTKWFETVQPLKENDIVILVDDQLPRNLWPKGVVTKTYPGQDGQVRVADIKTSTGIYKRPATKIAKLDVRLPTSASD